jgi:catechol-2,3-dioxygenase
VTGRSDLDDGTSAPVGSVSRPVPTPPAHHPMPARSLNHVNIRARRALVAELKEFYEGVVGLRAGWRPPFDSTGHWLYLGETPVVHLVEDERMLESTAPRSPVVDHVSFSCVGLAEFEALLRTKGIPFHRSAVPATALVQLLFVDPAGNGVELQFADGTD